MRTRSLVIALVLALTSCALTLAREALIMKAPGAEPLSGRIVPEDNPEELARKSGCLECHSVDKAVTGPAFRAVADRYKDDAKARTALIEKVSKGGKGNWTEISRGIPMPPHSKILSSAEISRLVDWILSLKNQ
jgi:cytochrome c